MKEKERNDGAHSTGSQYYRGAGRINQSQRWLEATVEANVALMLQLLMEAFPAAETQY